MAKLTKEQMIERIKAFLGERDDDEALALYEDISDTFEPDPENWKEKYEANDKEWRARYRKRFMEGDVSRETSADDGEESENEAPPKTYTFDELFEEKRED